LARRYGGNAIVPLGVDRFGQSGDIPDLYRAYGIDTEAILDAAACACLTAMLPTTDPPL
jgi:pyruvate dehydrogenase E1 component